MAKKQDTKPEEKEAVEQPKADAKADAKAEQPKQEKQSKASANKLVTCTYVGQYAGFTTDSANFKRDKPVKVSQSYFKELKKKYGADLIEGKPKKA